eukprot:scaffold12116_cov125-Cylindrotheca_fusiformis.AAC.2
MGASLFIACWDNSHTMTTAWLQSASFHHNINNKQQQQQQRYSTPRISHSYPSPLLFLYLNEDDPGPSSSSTPMHNDATTTATTTQPTIDVVDDDENNSNNTVAVEKTNPTNGTFGDIMSSGNALFRDGLVTSSLDNCSLSQVYGIHHPLDRIAVTANGNLQRLFSSYYDAPVQVVVEHCYPTTTTTTTTQEGKGKEWDHRVRLTLFDNQVTFCTADSKVQLHNADCQELVESGQVGLGQLFRYQNVLPEFHLLAAGPTKEGGFWRNYTLDCSFMTCHIHETFCPNVWNLSPPPPIEPQ